MMQACHLQVAWLDEVAAKARFGRWIDGRFPTLVPFPKTGKARGGRSTSKAGKGHRDSPTDNEGDHVSASREHFVRLRKLRSGDAAK